MVNVLWNAEFCKVKSIKIPLGPLAIANSPTIHHNAPSLAEWDTESWRRVNCGHYQGRGSSHTGEDKHNSSHCHRIRREQSSDGERGEYLGIFIFRLKLISILRIQNMKPRQEVVKKCCKIFQDSKYFPKKLWQRPASLSLLSSRV